MSQVPRSHLIPIGEFRDTWPQDPQHRDEHSWGMAALERKMKFCQISDNSWKLLSINGLITFLTKFWVATLEWLPCLLLSFHPCQVALWHWLNFPLVYNCAGVIFSPSCLNKFPMCQYQCLYHGLIESAKRIADIFVAIETGHDVTQLVSFPFAIYRASFWTWSPFVSRGITLKYNSILVQSPFCSKEDYRILRYFLRKVQSDDNIAVWLMCIPDYSKKKIQVE